jgi:heptaprenyl diphosphate synthase
MEDGIRVRNKEVERAVLAMVHSGGKLLRPAYLLLFSRFGPRRDRKKAVALAAAVEMLHTATLIHDDVVDEADVRRNLPTVRSQVGNRTAVYAGDCLFVCCFKLLAEYASSLESARLNFHSMDRILSGELGQMDTRYDVSVTVDQYIENISGKTAELFALSCFAGAYESGCSEEFAHECREIGANIGVAFQIVDDILDYTETAEHIGKPAGDDVRQGVYSLPLLFALDEGRERLLPYLEKKGSLSAEEAQCVCRLVRVSGGVVKARQRADAYTRKALEAIKTLPDTETGTREALFEITETLLTRTA